MAITIYEDTDGSITYGGAGWAADNIAPNSNTTSQRTSTNGNTATWVSPIACHSIYLGGQTASDYGNFSVSVDGITQGIFSQYSGFQSSAGSYYGRDITPIFRDPTGQDKLHTVVLTNLSSSKLSVDFIMACAGQPASPNPGAYVAFGDSWTVGTGTQAVWGAFASQVQGLLSSYYKRPITLTNNGLNGDMTVAQDSTKVGGQWRSKASLIDLAPQFATILFGANDLSNQNQALPAIAYASNLATICMLIEDNIDVYGRFGPKPRYALGTPGYLTPACLSLQFSAKAAPSMPSGLKNLRAAAAAVDRIGQLFPWLDIAPVYNAMGEDSGLLFPNNAGDAGLHPNESGHTAIASAFAFALGVTRQGYLASA